MADLYNLLNDLDQSQLADELLTNPLDPTSNDTNDDNDVQQDDATPRRNVALPPALAEAARMKNNTIKFRDRLSTVTATTVATSGTADDDGWDNNDNEDDDDDDNMMTKPMNDKLGLGKSRKSRSNLSALFGSTPEYDDDDEEVNKERQIQNLPYTQLKQWWIQEMKCPELCMYKDDLMTLALDLVQHQQEDAIDNIAATQMNPNLIALLQSLLRIDMERIKFLICDILKIRLQKIEHYYLYYRHNIEYYQTYMSPNELQFLQDYGMTIEQHFQRTVTNHIPQRVFQNLYEPNMITEPNFYQYVFVECIADRTQLRTNNKDNNNNNNDDEDNDIRTNNPMLIEKKKGDYLITRYEQIRPNYLRGELQMTL